MVQHERGTLNNKPAARMGVLCDVIFCEGSCMEWKEDVGLMICHYSESMTS